MKKSFILVSLLFLIFLPSNIFAEEYTASLYTQYYNADDRQNALSNVMGLGYHTGTAQTQLNASWSTNYYYTDLLNVSSYRGGVLKIPFYSIFYPQAQSFSVHDEEWTETCIKWVRTNCSQNNVCDYHCTEVSSGDQGTYNNFYDNYEPNASFNFRFYYNDSSHWTPCNLEGSNIVCPIPQDATTMYNITIFHKIIGKASFTYYLALGRGIFVYTNGTQAIVDSNNQINSNITDSSTNSSSENQNIIDDFNSNVASNSTISSLITMPITIFQKILNSVNSSCTPFTLGNLLGTNVVFPCVNIENYIGSTLYNIIDVIISGLFIFSISKTMIKVFNNFTSLKDKGDILGGVD